MGGCNVAKLQAVTGVTAVACALGAPTVAHAQTAEIRIVKRADRATAPVGDPVGYTIEVANIGGQPVRNAFVLDAPDAALRFVGRVRATIDGRAVPANPRRDNPRSRRLLRFGPFDIPTGGTLVIAYQSTIGADVAPGPVRNRARVMDGGGVALSSTVETVVQIVDDPGFDEGLVAGRVFCDDDGDGRLGHAERGFAGARVYIDTGWYAVTDSAGLFHLSQIDPGVHAVKLDPDTLAGGRPRGPSTHVAHITRGLPLKLDFPVACALVQVTSRHRRATLTYASKTPVEPPAPTSRGVTGSLSTMLASVDDVPLAMPSVRAKNAGSRTFLVAVKLGETATATAWVARISRHDPAGATVPMVRTFRGSGAPPGSITWDGKDDAGADVSPGLYSVAIAVRTDVPGTLAVSRRVPVGVSGTTAARDPETETWRGRLFRGPSKQPTATPELETRVAAVAARVRVGDKVALEVHGDGTGTKLAAVARTQRRAKLVASLLIAAGVPAAAIDARGRGSMATLQRPTSQAGRAANERVIVTVAYAAPQAAPIEVPAVIEGPAGVRVDGAEVAVSPTGSFAATTQGPGCVELQAATGELSAACPPGATPPAPATRDVEIRADLATGTFVAAGAMLPVGWGQVDIRVLDANAGALRLDVPDDLPVTSWSTRVTSSTGEVVHRRAGSGRPPATYALDTAELTPRVSYSVELHTVGADGSVGSAAPVTFVYQPAPTATAVAGLSRTGVMFRGKRTLTAGLKNTLSKFATIAGKTPGQAYAIAIRANVRGAVTDVDKRLALAARRATVVKYMRALGVADGRYEVTVTAARKGAIAVSTAAPNRATAPVAARAQPRVVVNGAAQTVTADQLRFIVAVPSGDPVVLDVVLPTGRHVRLVQAAPAEAPAPEPTQSPPPEPALDIGSVLAANLRVRLPPAGTVLSHDELTVTGTTHPYNSVSINGEPVHVDPAGRFVAAVELPAGKSTLAIVARDIAGHEVALAWPLEVTQADMVFLGVVEAAAATAYDPDRGFSTAGAAVDGMTDATSIRIGPVLLHGRAAAYLKGRFREFDVTAHIDTARAEDREGFFDQTIEPNRDPYAVHGDSAREVRDATTRGRVYVHITDGAGTAGTVGSIRGGVRGGDLFRYERTVYGAQLHIEDADILDGHDVDLSAFTAFDEVGLSRDVNLFRATGGALYYLRHASVVEGSERVRVIVRDRDSGLVSAERLAERDIDYAIDYRTGRVLFTAPPASVATGGWLLDNPDTTATPLDGDPVFVEVHYEHTDAAGMAGAPTGIYVRDTVGDLSVGAGAVTEGREGDDYLLWGVDAHYRLGERSTVTAEVAGSENADASNMRSDDGGLSFAPFGTASADHSLGFKATATLHLGDFADGGALAATRANLYAQTLDSGFSSMQTALEQGRTKLGALITHDVSARDRLSIKHDADLVDASDRTSLRTGAQWRRRAGKWVYAVETGYHHLSDGAELAAERLGAGALAAYQLTGRVTVRASQELVHNVGDNDPVLDGRNGVPGATTTVGGDFELAPDLVLSLDESVRWNGDNATRFGLRTKLGDDGTLYIREQVGSRGGRLVSTTIVGADERFGARAGTRSYGEYQLETGALGSRNRAVLGLGHRWRVAPGVRLGVGYEHQQIFGGVTPEGVPIGDNQRDVVHIGGEYTARADVKAAARAELRFDDGQSEIDTPTAAPGVLPPGERVQLVVGAGADYKPANGVTLIGRARYSRTEDRSNQRLPVQPEAVADSFVAAEFAEALAGGALRPRATPWLDVFGQYAYQIDQRPSAVQDGAPRTVAHIMSVASMTRLPMRLRLSTKLAWKRTRLVAPAIGATELSSRTTSLLGLIRAAYRFYGHWDAAAEYRHLHIYRPRDVEEARDGALVEVTYTLRRRFRLGVGYNLSRFSDNELRDLERDSHGLFFRVVGTY